MTGYSVQGTDMPFCVFCDQLLTVKYEHLNVGMQLTWSCAQSLEESQPTKTNQQHDCS